MLRNLKGGTGEMGIKTFCRSRLSRKTTISSLLTSAGQQDNDIFESLPRRIHALGSNQPDGSKTDSNVQRKDLGVWFKLRFSFSRSGLGLRFKRSDSWVMPKAAWPLHLSGSSIECQSWEGYQKSSCSTSLFDR